MKKPFLLLPLAAGSLALTSCYSTSISDTASASGGSAAYKGELDGFELFRISEREEISESSIRSALGRSTGSSVRIPSGGRILLVQSGAAYPDAALVKAMETHYEVVPFNGVPTDTVWDANHGKKLRLAAAQTGARHIVVVWGKLDTAQDEMATGAISWVPMAGRVIADEKQSTRITTTAAVIDTASGAWRSVAAEPVTRSTVSSHISRDTRWVRQVDALKAQSYPALALRVATL